MRAAKVMDFGAQMASAARLAATFPQVGQDLRNRYRVVLLDEYQDTGHAQRVALSALFGGGVDDGLALTAVGDPIQSIYGWRGASATNLPRFMHRLPAIRRHPRAGAGAADQLAQPAAGTARRQRHFGGGAAALGCGARAALAPGRPARHRPLRVASRCAGRTRVDRRPPARALPASPGRGRQPADRRGAGAPQRRRRTHRRCACAPAESRSRSSAWPGCCRSPRSPTWWPCCGWSPTRRPARRRCGCWPVRDGGSVAGISPRCGGARWRLAGEQRRARRPRPSRSRWRPVPTPTPRVWPTRSATPARPSSYSAAGYRRISALAGEMQRAARPPRSFPARPGRRGAPRAGRRLRSPGRSTAALPRAGPAPSISTRSPTWSPATPNAQPPASRTCLRRRRCWACWPTWTRPRWSRTVCRRPSWRSPGTGSRCSPCMPPKVWSGRWWRWRTCRAEYFRRPRRGAAGLPMPPSCRRCCAATAPRRARLGVPVLDTSDVTNRKQLSDKISEHRRQLDQRRIDEERRLLYVGITRAEDTLLVSGHHWGRHRDQTAWPVGFPVRTQGRHRPFGRGRRSLRGGGTVGAGARRR